MAAILPNLHTPTRTLLFTFTPIYAYILHITLCITSIIDYYFLRGSAPTPPIDFLDFVCISAHPAFSSGYKPSSLAQDCVFLREKKY